MVDFPEPEGAHDRYVFVWINSNGGAIKCLYHLCPHFIDLPNVGELNNGLDLTLFHIGFH